jgi:hypothetical protein
MTQSSFFSTAGMEGQQSIEAWRQAMAEVCFRLDVQSANADRMRGEIRAWQSDVLGISKTKADSHRLIRRREAAKADIAHRGHARRSRSSDDHDATPADRACITRA